MGADTVTRESVSRSALQEFQILESRDHPGILRALDFQEHEIGPAILFRREVDEIRLDHFLRQRGPSLSLDTRLDLSRQIADAVRYAHSHRVIHRALSPKSILVVQPDSDQPRFGSSIGRPADFYLLDLRAVLPLHAVRHSIRANILRNLRSSIWRLNRLSTQTEKLRAARCGAQGLARYRERQGSRLE